MRHSLIPGLLSNLAFNLKRQRTKVALFEWGKAYQKSKETELLSLVYTNQSIRHWSKRKDDSPFYELKSVVESLFRQFNLKIELSELKNDWAAGGITYLYKNKIIATLAILSESILKEYETKTTDEVAVAEIDFDLFFKYIRHMTLEIVEVSKFPFVYRDLSLLVDNAIPFETIKSIAIKNGGKLLKEVLLFDAYQGDKIQKGKKSYAISFKLQNSNATLSDREIDETMSRLVTAITNEAKAGVRGI